MQIEQIYDENLKQKWNNFVIDNSSPAAFLQSWEWGEFKKNKLGHTIYRLVVSQNEDEWVAVGLFVKQPLPGGKFYLNCAKGIINKQNTNNNTQNILVLLSQEIKKLSKKEKLVFFRIAPPYSNNYQSQNADYKSPQILTHVKEPEKTLIVDLQKSEEELLTGMHQKTRYNIRLAEKKDVIINQAKDINAFYNLSQQTAVRDRINIFSKSYYENLLNISDSELKIEQFTAWHKDTPLSSIIVTGFGDTATYFYGASANEYRNLMPNYLVQWQAIKWAKEYNYKYYDFWGLDENNPKWRGITRFKNGFVSEDTGQHVHFTGTYDFVLNKKWYNLYRLLKPVSKLINTLRS